MMRNTYQNSILLGTVLWIVSLAAFGQTTAFPTGLASPSASGGIYGLNPATAAAAAQAQQSAQAKTAQDAQIRAAQEAQIRAAQEAQVKAAQEAQARAAQEAQAKAAIEKLRAEEPPSPFQQFVQQTSGRMLPIYGQHLFNTASSYAPVSQAVVPPDYLIGPGDEILLQIWGSIDAEASLVVNRHGQVNLPKIGVINLVGVRAGDLESVLRSKIGRIFINFDLNATLGRLRSTQIYVVGQARQPGTYTVSSLSTLINALFEVGGPNSNGSMRNIQLKRGGRIVGVMDLYDFIARGDRSGDVPLQPGDVIVIPPVGPRVAVLGAFGQPAIYELKGAGSVGEVLALGGGLSVLAKPGKASLERIDPAADKPRRVEVFALDPAGMSHPLRDGDILTLFEIGPQFANAVTLRGNVETPLRYPYTEGMRIRDLIPSREALITSDYFKRKNLLVQFEETGKTGKELEQPSAPIKTESDPSGKTGATPADPNKPDAGATDLVKTDSMSPGAASIERGARNLLDEVNWDYAVIERLDRATLTTRLIPFNLGRAMLDANDSNNLPLESGDVVTILSRKDLRVPQDRSSRLVRVEGEVATPGIYQIEAGETLPQLLGRLGGVTGNAYLYGTEFTRESVRSLQQKNLDALIRKVESQLQAESGDLLANINIQTDPNAQTQLLAQQQLQQQQLERLRVLKSSGRVSLELPSAAATLDALPALPLEDGDTIHVPSQPGFVSVVGEVYNENAIIYRSGKTVGDVLASAGATSGAELDNAFVMRADGSVKTARDSNALFSMGGFDSIELMPGDTVVVPAKLDRRTGWTKFVSGLKDWTQILYQMGLGIAAWEALR